MANINVNQYNETNYIIGNLYYERVCDTNIVKKGEVAIYDTERRNYHFYPKDSFKCDNWESEINEKIQEINKEIETRDDANIVCLKYYSELNSVPCDNKIYIYTSTPWAGALKSKRKTICRLFKYIVAVKNGIKYELNFMKFYIGKDKSINCIMKQIQFDKVVDDTKVNLTDKMVNRNGICYPSKYTTQNEKELIDILSMKTNKSIYYNPQVRFEDDANLILKSFIEFICCCETNRDKENILN